MISMDFIAFPTRINRRGWLERYGTPEGAVINLLRIMARSARSGGWVGVDQFGLRDFFTETGARRGLQPDAISSVNHTLEDLGIEWFRVEAVVREEPRGREEDSFSVTVSLSGKGTDVLKVTI